MTIISSEAFRYCSGLKSVTIPNSVTSIGYSAFDGCKGLTSVTIPNSVTIISSEAFRYCSGLKSVTIPNSVTFIGDEAFRYCSGLKSVTIPNSVTFIGDEAFRDCSALPSVTIPNSVTSIGERAFSGCSNLESVTIGAGVLSIGSSVFSGHQPAKVIWLTNTPPEGYKNAAGKVNYVANDLYTSLDNKGVYPFLSSIFEVDGVKYVPVSPAERTCYAIDCLYDERAENIVIGKTVNYKGIDMTVTLVNKYTCYQNQFVKKVNLSFDGITGNYSFSGCNSIREVTLNNGNYIAIYAFSNINSEFTATINCKGVIGSNAFYQSTGLKMLEVGSNVTNINNDAFNGCNSLIAANIQNKGLIGAKAFQNCTAMTTATLGEEVTSIGNNAFDGCSSLEKIVIPNSVTYLGTYAFQNCRKMTSAKIGTSVKTIGQYAFNGCTTLPKIQIPHSVTAINNNVFEKCSSLKTVIMDDGQEAELKLGYNYFSSGGNKPLFSDCPLDSVYIGRNISYSTESKYGYSPFYRNTSLRSVHITDKETEISPNEFYGCSNLKNVRIGDGVTTIGDWAFSGCSSIDYFSFGSSVKTIGKEAFSDCTAVTKLISHATTPPSCGSQALDDINKWNCTLSVPKGYVSAYQQAAQWKEFFFINDDATTAIKPISDNAVEIIENYDLNGTRQNRLQKGVNIVRMSDGTVKKVIVK